jgi:hypothetical protein
VTDGEPTWLHQWPSDGCPILRLGRVGDDLIVEWPGLGTIRSDTAGARNEVSVSPGAPPHVLERLTDIVAAFQRHLRGGVTLHASSVALGSDAIACVGDSGAGKSTLAATLCRSDRFALVSDDTAALLMEGSSIQIEPTERRHWLRPDMAKAFAINPGDHPKVALDAPHRANGPVELRGIISLVFDEHRPEPQLLPLRGVSAFLTLSYSAFRMAIDVPDVLRRELDNLARIAREVPVFELRRRRDPAAMAECCDLVRRLLQGFVQGRAFDDD